MWKAPGLATRGGQRRQQLRQQMAALAISLKDYPVIGQKGSPFLDGYSYGEWLKKKGFECIGCGCYSSVYVKGDSQRVIKVGRGGDSWMDYIRWAHREKYCGKFAPMVYSYKWHPYPKGGGFYVAVVERMKEAACCDEKGKGWFLSETTQMVMRDNTYAMEVLDAKEPGLTPFLKQFKAQFKDYWWDMHGANMMLRFDGSFVITDPITRSREASAANDNFKTERFKLKDLCAA